MIDLKSLLGKSRRESTSYYLVDHTKMVLNLSMGILSSFFKDIKTEDKKRMIAECILHDIGKCCKSVQDYLKKKTSYTDENGIETSARSDSKLKHNVISWAFAKRVTNDNFIPKTVLYHHPNYTKDITCNDVLYSIRKNLKLGKTDNDVVTSDDLETMTNFLEYFIEYSNEQFGIDITDIVNCNNEVDASINDESLFTGVDKLFNKTLRNTKFKLNYDMFDSECVNDILRSILIFSDRLVSSEKCDNTKIINNDIAYIQNIVASYNKQTNHDIVDFRNVYNSERTIKQYKSLEDLSTKNNLIIPAQAGFGKTLIGIVGSTMMSNKKVLWIMPKNEIASGTYISVLDELKHANLENVKVGLFFAGEMICDNTGTGCAEQDDLDILVTNIDSILNYTVKNNVAHLMINLYTSTIVFDEYHEFVTRGPMFSEFLKLVKCRTCYTNSKTLFLSATPYEFQPFSMKYDFGIEYCSNSKELFINKDMLVNLRVYETDDLSKVSTTVEDSIVIGGTVKMAQDYKRKHTESFLCHSNFTKEDKDSNREFLYKTHGKYSAQADRKSIIGTSIIGTGCDISTKELVDCNISPDDMIQRGCGRTGRFNEPYYDNNVNYILVHITDKNKIKNIIEGTFSVELYDKWFQTIKKYDGMSLSKGTMYDIRQKFIDDNSELYVDMYIDMFIASLKALNDMGFKKGSTAQKKKDETIMSNSMTHRGNGKNVFVIARCDDGTWCSPIVIQEYRLTQNNEERDYANIPSRKEYIMSNENYPTPSQLKNKYGFKEKGNYNIENCIKFAKSSKMPLPLFDFKYSKEMGLYKEKDNSYE